MQEFFLSIPPPTQEQRVIAAKLVEFDDAGSINRSARPQFGGSARNAVRSCYKEHVCTVFRD